MVDVLQELRDKVHAIIKIIEESPAEELVLLEELAHQMEEELENLEEE